MSTATFFKKNTSVARRRRMRWFWVLTLIAATGGSLSAQTVLIWGPNGSGAPAGGDGAWNLSSPFWTSTGGSSDLAWPGAGADYAALFSGTGGTVNLSGNITAAGLSFDVINYSLNFSGAGNSLTLARSSGLAPRIEGTFWRPGFSINTVINGALAGAAGVNFSNGAIGLAGNNTITGGINIGGATVSLYSSPGAFLASNTLTMGATIADGGRIGGGGTFIYDNMNATALTSQTFSALQIVSGDANVQTNWNGVATVALNFGSQTRATGATVAYYARVNPGFIGADNKINLTSQGTGFIDLGTFFNTDAVTNSADYAWKDSAGYLRQIKYGTDAGTATTGATTSITPGANSYFQMTGAVSAQASATMKTLKISGARNMTLGSGATLTVSGLLKTGGDESTGSASIISGGVAIRANANDEFIVRADQIGDTLTINTPIVDNGTTALVKSGFGTLVIGAASSYGGTTYINGGAIRLSNAAALPSGSNVRFNGGVLELTSSSSNAFTVGTGGGQVQWAGDGGFSAFGSAVTLNLNSGAPLTWGAIDFVPNGNSLILGSGRSNNMLTLANDIDLGSVMRTVRVNFGTGPSLPAANGALAGKITGPGGLVITGGGSLLLTNANTYAGGTNILDGTLIVGNDAALGTGPITFGGSITGGLLMGNAARTINNDIVFLPNASAPFQIGGTAALTFNGALSGSGTLATTGSNTVTFNGSSPNFSGLAQLLNDLVIIGNDNAFGTGTVQFSAVAMQGNGAPRTISNPGLLYPTTIAGSSDLTFTGLLKNDYVSNMTLTITNTGVTTFGAIDLADAGVARTVTFAVSGSSTAFITGTIASGFNTTTSALSKSSSGTLTITSTANTYGGATTITGGVLAVNSLANGGANSSVGKSSSSAGNLIINNATLRYLGSGSSTDRLFQVGQTTAGGTATLDASGSGSVSFTNAGSLTFGTNNQARNLVLTGSNTGNNSLAAVLNNNGTGQTSLTKNGVGTWVFSGGGNYTGATTVNAGVLVMNGSSGNSATTVVGGAISGTGAIGSLAVQSGGAAAPGTASGTGTLNTKAFNLLGGGSLKLKIGGIGASAFDQVSVTGTVSLAGDAQISLFGAYAPVVGDKFFVIVNDGSDAVTGTFANAVANQFNVSGVVFTVNYADNFGGSGVGNDVSLTIASVPEPTTTALFLIGLTVFANRRRRP